MQFIVQKHINYQKEKRGKNPSDYDWLKKCYADDNNVDLLYYTCPYYKLTLEQLNKDLIEEMKNDEANPKKYDVYKYVEVYSPECLLYN